MNKPLKKLRIQFIIVMMSIVIFFLVAIFSVEYISTRKTMIQSAEGALAVALEMAERGESIRPVWDIPEEVPERPEDSAGEEETSDEKTSEAASDEKSGKTTGAEKETRSEEKRDKLPDNVDNMMKGRMMDRYGDEGTRTPVLVLQVGSEGSYEAVRNDMFYMESSYIDELFQATPYQDVKESQTESCSLSSLNMRYMIRIKDKDKYIGYVDVSDNISSLSKLVKRAVLISAGVIVIMFIISLFLSARVLAPVRKAWDDQKRFVADASHELKTPLAVIISNTDMIVKSKDKNSDKNQRRLDNIQMESGRMKELVQELLEVARGDIENKEMQHEQLNLSELVYDQMLVWEPAYFESSREIETDIEEDISIKGDVTKLRRLVDILLDNALKYGYEKTAVSLILKETTKGQVRLEVTNTGQPLADDEKELVFERFYRADKSRESTPGYGLGLAIAADIVNEHHGKIGAVSDGKDKNTFYVVF